MALNIDIGIDKQEATYSITIKNNSKTIVIDKGNGATININTDKLFKDISYTLLRLRNIATSKDCLELLNAKSKYFIYTSYIYEIITGERIKDDICIMSLRRRLKFFEGLKDRIFLV
jgi:hypothetical protein